MTDWLLLLKALILGIVEGLTEFLPISSTGHMIIVGDLLNYTNEQSKVFEIVIQFAAILAVCWLYRARILEVVAGMWQPGPQQRFALNILVAFMPAAVLGLLLHGVIKQYLFNPLTVAGALVGGGIFILWIERRHLPERFGSVDDITWREALKVGFAQALAMFPGVSRAGATIIGGMVFGLSRKAATELSFFLAIPTMTAATVLDLYKARDILSFDDVPVFAVGFITSFIFAMLAIKGLLRYISHHNFNAFAWYRIVFGLIVLATAYTGLVDWHA
ncbi:undecaprenyl-diphosphate phosphatase [uncultured Thiodictyon sp.]|uniref:undecaprenyl-diphosphate phosphatase n=1 Tax=uncultured Thiodictyon sp. TaxID=1846217 RepID=UPI0025EF5182|nr:undecaprenyl-diphosphate phosphatase [uncultured Thiodictyon sp.]